MYKIKDKKGYYWDGSKFSDFDSAVSYANAADLPPFIESREGKRLVAFCSFAVIYYYFADPTPGDLLEQARGFWCK